MVIIGNVISQNILKQDSENLISKLEDLKDNINQTDIAKEKVNQIYELFILQSTQHIIINDFRLLHIMRWKFSNYVFHFLLKALFLNP